MIKKHKIVVAVSGASGAIYAKVLFDKLLQMKDQIKEVSILMSENARFVWKTELGDKALCLVDLGHHLPNTNIEMIVSRLIDLNKLGLELFI